MKYSHDSFIIRNRNLHLYTGLTTVPPLRRRSSQPNRRSPGPGRRFKSTSKTIPKTPTSSRKPKLDDEPTLVLKKSTTPIHLREPKEKTKPSKTKPEDPDHSALLIRALTASLRKNMNPDPTRLHGTRPKGFFPNPTPEGTYEHFIKTPWGQDEAVRLHEGIISTLPPDSLTIATQLASAKVSNPLIPAHYNTPPGHRALKMLENNAKAHLQLRIDNGDNVIPLSSTSHWSTPSAAHQLTHGRRTNFRLS